MPTSDPLVFVRYAGRACSSSSRRRSCVLMGGPVLGYVVGARRLDRDPRRSASLIERHARTRERQGAGRPQLRRADGARLDRRNRHPRGRLAGRTGRRSHGGAARARRVHGLPRHDPGPAPHGEEHAPLMSQTRKILLGAVGAYLLLTRPRVHPLRVRRPQRGVRAAGRVRRSTTWIDLPGSLDINKAVLYLVLSGDPDLRLDGLHRQPDAGAAEPHPDRGRGALRPDARQHHAREHGRQDGGEVVPVHRRAVPLHLVQQPDRVHPAADRRTTTFTILGLEIPTFGIYAATANVSVPLVLALIVFVSYTTEGIRAKGVVGYLKSLIPAGVTGAMAGFIFVPRAAVERDADRLALRSSVRQHARRPPDHPVHGRRPGDHPRHRRASASFLLPLGLVLYLFEVGLVATLQAFIFATLSAIYIGGAVAESH